MKCAYCGKEKSKGWINDERFCSCSCAQKDFEEKFFEDKLESENPDFSDYYDIDYRKY